MKNASLFFRNSAKRNNLLIELVARNVVQPKRAPLIDMRQTRWASKHEHFYSGYKFIVTACEVIGWGLYKDTLSDNFVM